MYDNFLSISSNQEVIKGKCVVNGTNRLLISNELMVNMSPII